MVSHDVSAVFRAISDPTRREILDLLRDENLNVGDISRQFPVSRPAISKHLRILKEAGLVQERKQGRERLYSGHFEPLRGVREWVGGEPASGAPSKDREPSQRGPAMRSAAVPPSPARSDWQVW